MNWWIVVLSIVGFLDSLYIYVKKRRNERLVCVIGSNCNKVIRSRYATLFGVDNTVVGMAYYLLLIVVFGQSFVALPSVVLPAIVLVGAFAATISLYLLIIQLFVLKEWCDYCLLAAVINIVLFLLLS